MSAMPDKTLQILLALLEGPAHGYGIKQRVEERTRGRVRLGSGTLYEAVHRLVGAGHIEEVEVPGDEPTSGGPPRRFYALTAAGRDALVTEVRRLESVVSYAKRHALLREV